MTEGAEVPVPQPEPNKPPEGPKKGLSRRDFLKITGAGIGIVSAGGVAHMAKEVIDSSDRNDQTVEIDGTRITYREHSPEGKEVIDKTKAVIYLIGWPWNAAEDSVQEFPKQLANSFKSRAFNISTKRGSDDRESLVKQAQSLKKFLQSQGIKELTIVGHSTGALKAAYLENELQKDELIKVKGLVLANPIGLNKKGLISLLKAFYYDTVTLGPQEREAAKDSNRPGKYKNVMTPEPPQSEIQAGFTRSIARNIKEFGWGYVPLLLSQAKMLTSEDNIYSRVKSPVVVIASERFKGEFESKLPARDEVSDIEKYAPRSSAEKEPETNYEKQLTEKASKTSGFLQKHMDALKNRINRAQITRGREKLLQPKKGEGKFGSAEKVKLLRSSRQADHEAVPGPRAGIVSDISAGIFDRMKRPPKS